jgi:2-oxo-4-hydroxy-4-carboxy--5-ureidoimidazoline (OHCU) decarboxylase
MVTTLCFQGILALDARPFHHPEPRSSGTSEPFSSTPHGSQTGAGFRRARAKAGARLAQWNAQYRAVWLRFTICAGRYDQTSISAEFERRLAGEPVVEYRTAWTEIAAIMASRLAVRLQVPAMPV